ncbi:hypothetical protein Tco_0149186 [Tanacetum coccineum]
MKQMTSMCDMVGQFIQKKEKEKRIEEQQAAKDRYWNIPCVATTPDSPEINSLIMEDEHLDTIPETESDELIKSSVEDLVQIPSESEDSFEGNSNRKYHCQFPPELNNLVLMPIYDFLESLLHLQIIRNEFSTKIDSLLDEFHTKLVYDNSVSPPLEEFNSKNPSRVILSISNPASEDSDYSSEVRLTFILMVMTQYPPIQPMTLWRHPRGWPNISASTPCPPYNWILDFFLPVMTMIHLEDSSSLPKEEEKRIEEEQAAKDRYWKIPICYDDDDDEGSEDLVQIPNESEDSFKGECDLPPDDDSSKNHDLTFSNPLFDIDEDFTSKSLLHRDTSINDSQKIDSLLDEFTGELTLPHSIPPGIDDVNLDPEGDILFLKVVLDNSFSRLTIAVVRRILVDLPIFSPTHPALQLDFDFIPSHNDLGSNLDDSSPSEDRNKIYDPGICIKVKSTTFLATLSPVIDTLLPFSSENEDKVFNHDILAYMEKSPPSSSHRGLKAFQLSLECPMLIHGDNTPNLGVCHPHSYPP